MSDETRRAVGAGTTEAQWLHWLDTGIQRRSNAAALVPAGCRAVVVAPHPDDELLGLAGQLMAWAELGRLVTVIAVTDGEASHRDRLRRDERELAATRRRESESGWRQLGLETSVGQRLALPDAAVPAFEAVLVDRLCNALRADDVVFATWRLDGHPDHEATGRAAAQACARLGCRLYEYPVWMWHWAGPNDSRVPWQRFSRIDLSPRQQSGKTLAVAEHASQLEAGGGHGAVLPADLLAHWLRPWECVIHRDDGEG